MLRQVPSDYRGRGAASCQVLGAKRLPLIWTSGRGPPSGWWQRRDAALIAQRPFVSGFHSWVGVLATLEKFPRPSGRLDVHTVQRFRAPRCLLSFMN